MSQSESNESGDNDDIYRCRKCGTPREFSGERVTCWGTTKNPHRGEPVDVVYPCGCCGDPITTAEICSDCADDSETDAFTHPEEAWEKVTTGSGGDSE